MNKLMYICLFSLPLMVMSCPDQNNCPYHNSNEPHGQRMGDQSSQQYNFPQRHRLSNPNQNWNQPEMRNQNFNQPVMPEQNLPAEQDFNQPVMPEQNLPAEQDFNQPDLNQPVMPEQDWNNQSSMRNQSWNNQTAMGDAPMDKMNDNDLQARIRERLAGNWFGKNFDAVNVNVSNGVITITGIVLSNEDKQEIEKRIREIAHDRQINNQLQVNTTAQPATSSY